MLSEVYTPNGEVIINDLVKVENGTSWYVNLSIIYLKVETYLLAYVQDDDRQGKICLESTS